MDYLLEIRFAPDLEDAVLARLYLTRSTGSVAFDGGMTAYFDSPGEREAAIAALDELPVELQSLDRQRRDWLELYQQSLQPIIIGRTFVVAPDAALIPMSDRHSLVIPQEQAFGTGSHETTSLCIELLEGLDLKEKRGLDIGAGSGILALAMCMLGARKAVAFDNDLDAYAALRDNAIRNRVDRLSIFIGSLDALRGGAFDVITMNILPEVIIAMLPHVVSHMRGALILSGILSTRRDDVVAAAHELRLVKERVKGEWWAGRFER